MISHKQGAMVERLVAELLGFPEVGQIIVTRNVPERLTLPQDDRILTIENSTPAGFAANQNKAFQHCTLPFFCPLNPDIQLHFNPFPHLLAAIQKSGAALAAPLVKNPSGEIEDSMRFFPTVRSLLSKILGFSDGRYKVKDDQAFYPEWVAGMFMLFRSEDFRRLGGFDSQFFLYYEDVDICARTWKAGMKVLACPAVFVVHDAQRESHKNPQFMAWHLTSMTRYFFKHWGRLPSLANHE
jgi:N-acetylglucosaminyl-diphospho-decaprenol L-rhamnosyltransferase